MNNAELRTETYVPIKEAFEADELDALGERIIASGVLGRSRHYVALLRHLILCSLQGKSPKELEIAIEALGRDKNFDVSSDSAVRVYIHQLRKKLDTYYQSYDQASQYRLVIPKGQYALAILSQKSPPVALSQAGKSSRSLVTNSLLTTVICLLGLNLFFLSREDEVDSARLAQQIARHPIWGAVLEDDKPILLVMGDYYIFGELNSNGNIARMVREFNVNSRSDLEDLQFSDIERTENYLDLDLSYMPEGSAFALARVVPILQGSGKTVNITMMSDLTTADIRSNHIVYIGYISALEKLTDLSFAGSGLRIGRSYDELFNTKTTEYYTSDAGLPEEGQPFRDYGMFSTFPASSETQVVLIAGMRDAGLMHTAQTLSDQDGLNKLLAALDNDTDEAVASFEALFEVYGVDRLNFDASLVYANKLDSSRIWGYSEL